MALKLLDEGRYLEYQRQAVFWHNRTSEVVEHNLKLQKSNRRLRALNKKLKAAMVLVKSIKSIMETER